MIEFLVCLVAALLAIFGAVMGLKAGAFVALGRMLVSLIALFVAMRYWFLFSRTISDFQSTSVTIIALVVFWAVYLLTSVMLSKVRDTYTEVFESVQPSVIDSLLGGIFGLVSGSVFVTAVLLSLSVASMQYLIGYDPDKLPLPLDRAPLIAYRYVEAQVTGISEKDPAHTPLPSLKSDPNASPAIFWQ